MTDLMTLTQYAKYKNVTVGTVHYWLKKGYLKAIIIADKKFIDKNTNPQKQLK